MAKKFQTIVEYLTFLFGKEEYKNGQKRVFVAQKSKIRKFWKHSNQHSSLNLKTSKIAKYDRNNIADNSW